nr:flagella basal body P-ring formation protein FlgA [Desulfobacula sp.]
MAFPKFHRVLCLLITGFLWTCQGALADLLAEKSPESGAGIEITLKETSTVQSSRIFLQDIADIKADAFLKETLGKIDLGLSPKPDKIRSIDKGKILSMIQRERYLPKDSVITCPERIYVKRLSRKASVQDIQKYVEQRLSDSFKNREYQLVSLNVKGLEPYPSGEISFFSDSDEMVDKNGKLSLSVDIVIDGKRADRVSVTGLVGFYPLVRKGDIVSLFAGNDTLVIVTKGVCREDGAENDVIKVENLTSGKIVLGRIREKSKVEVLY